MTRRAPSPWFRTAPAVVAAFALTLALVVLATPAGPAAAATLGPDLLANGSFEAGGALPDGWSTTAWEPTAAFARDTAVAVDGSASARIVQSSANDAAVVQELHLKPDTWYLLSGWIRTEGVSDDGAGANLALMGTWSHTDGIHGTTGWTQVGLLFGSGATGVVTVGARLGHWSATSTGTAWFDALQLNEVSDLAGRRNWNIQLIVYDRIDTTVVDSAGVSHHVRSTIDADRVAAATDTVREFVNTDFPALDSGLMVPTLLPVTVPAQPLTTLSLFEPDQWYPGPDDGRGLRSPAADAVIVVWEPNAIDVDTGQPYLLTGYGGITPGQGTQQTYLSAILDSVTQYGHRNVLKHEMGHSLLDYFEAAQLTPLPTVSNHAVAGQYVHCGTGAAYDWREETLAEPIPNSIYSNDAGFTHDYYSGTIALAEDPTRCLGITPEAWAHGGPVAMPALPPLPSSPADPRAQLDHLVTQVRDLVSSGDLRRRDADGLLTTLRQVGRDLDRGHTTQAVRRLNGFTAEVGRLRARHRISHADADALTAAARAVVAALRPPR